MDDKIGVLKPTQRRELQQGLADCASCGAKAEYLRKIGVPNEALEARRDHAASVIQRALEIDAELKSGK